jgi:hypothetical protein
MQHPFMSVCVVCRCYLLQFYVSGVGGSVVSNYSAPICVRNMDVLTITSQPSKVCGRMDLGWLGVCARADVGGCFRKRHLGVSWRNPFPSHSPDLTPVT